jgi:hypothetical protein
VTVRPLKYTVGEMIDERTKLRINVWRDKIANGDDDALIIICGRTGTGKSNLALIIDELYPLETHPENVCLSNHTFVNRWDSVRSMRKEDRVLHFDELDMMNRNAMTRWNKDMITAYSKTRGLNILHLWCHPDISMIDGVFIRDRVNAIIITFEKSKRRPRKFYFYSQARIIDLLEKGKLRKLGTNLLTNPSTAKRYASYIGCFSKYKGPMQQIYLDAKKEGMNNAIHDLQRKYGSKSQKESINTVNTYNSTETTSIEKKKRGRPAKSRKEAEMVFDSKTEDKSSYVSEKEADS